MRTRIINKSIARLTPQEYKSLLFLNLGRKGEMQSVLLRAHQGIFPLRWAWPPRVAMLIDDEGVVHSWALIYQWVLTGDKDNDNDNKFMPDNAPHAYFYTRATSRRRGYGARLARHISRRYGYYYVHPWDEQSRLFFASVKTKISKVNNLPETHQGVA